MAMSLGVGFLTGIVAWLFIRAIEISQFWPATPGASHFLGLTVNRFWIVALPAIGGLLCGLVLQYGAKSAKGTGTADIMYALRRKNGHLSASHTFYKALASIFTICSGGAAGPEAPAVAIGAGMGSLAGSLKPMEPEFRRNLVVAGGAAGFAAVFNAPIAGVLFAIEVLLKEFGSQAFAMVILSTVTASVTTHLLMGNRAFVEVPASYAFNHVWELGYYAILAVVTAIVAKLFVQSYLTAEHYFEEQKKIPVALKPMLGGLLLGLLALGLPSVMGNGHKEIPDLILSENIFPWAWKAMLFLLIGKLIGTPLTIGSGGSGGIFVPFLLMGALVGGLCGRLIHMVSPDAATTGSYMVVGMGAMFAGITYAPFTAIILLFELTRDYSIILPLMFTVGITYLVALSIDPDSLDSRKLLRRGVRLHETVELRALEKYRVEELMSRDVKTIPQTMSLAKITEFIERHPYTGYPVVDQEGKLVGLISYAELHQTFNVPELPENGIIAKDIMRASIPTAFPDESVTEAVRRMQTQQVDRIPIIDPTSEKIIGILTKSNILGIYKKLLA
jgi:CIC family chloride channel protein